jgi:hypothetical protein
LIDHVICAFKYLCNLVFCQLNNYGVGLNKGKIITIIMIHYTLKAFDNVGRKMVGNVIDDGQRFFALF